MKGLEPVADVAAGQWIAELLPGLLGTVASVVPRGFAAYARVLHPVELDEGRTSLSWTQVCQMTGRIPHALMQWAAIAIPAGEAKAATARLGLRDDGDVKVGNLAAPALSALLEALASVTGEQECFHALWQGWGWVDGLGIQVLSASDDGRAVAASVSGVPLEVWEQPRLRLPGRDYLLFRGPLPAALNMGWHREPSGFEPQSPSLIWPADHLWCVGTDIDFDSTLIGGSADLINTVLKAPGLDAWPVEPDADLTAFADQLNTPS